MARPRVHDDALRARLLEQASALVATGGAAALTVRDLAARAGTSASAVYSLFGSRDDLVRAVGDEAFARFAERLAAVPTTADPAADLLGLGLAYRQHALDDPHFYRVTFGVLRDAVGRVLGVDDDAAQEPALGLWALVHGLVELELDGLLPGRADDRFARVLRAAGPAILGA